MTNAKGLFQVKHLVQEAEKAIIEAQETVDPGKLHHAHNMVLQSKEYLQETIANGSVLNSDEETQIQHMKDWVRRLEETLHAIETAD